MRLSVPLFSQRDERWRKKKLGFSNLSFGDYGCAVACMAMLACYYGKDTDPGKLNDDLKEKNGFVGGNIVWQAINRVYPDIKFTSFRDYPLDPAPVKSISAQIKKGKPVLCWVDCNPNQPGNQMHWVILKGIEGDDYWLNDPWFGDEVLFSKRYGKPVIGILGHRFFTGPVPPTLGEEKKYTEAEMTQMRHERDRNWNLYCEEKAKREGLEAQVKDLEKRIAELEQWQGEYINSLSEQLKCSADESAIKGAIEELLSVEEQKNQVEAKTMGLQKLVDKLNVDLDACEEEKMKALEQYKGTLSSLKEAEKMAKKAAGLELMVVQLQKRRTLDRFKTSELLPAVFKELWRRIFKK
ncbi:MAG: C39 family peptidase [Candidatus Heimdallarchaeota archaeon]